MLQIWHQKWWMRWMSSRAKFLSKFTPNLNKTFIKSQNLSCSLVRNLSQSIWNLHNIAPLKKRRDLIILLCRITTNKMRRDPTTRMFNKTWNPIRLSSALITSLTALNKRRCQRQRNRNSQLRVQICCTTWQTKRDMHSWSNICIRGTMT